MQEKNGSLDGRERLGKAVHKLSESFSIRLTAKQFLVYFRFCCNVFRDLMLKALSKMRLRHDDITGAGVVFEASSSYKNSTTEFLSFERSLGTNE